MKQLLFILICSISISSFSKEWKSLKQFQDETNQNRLSQKDWLCKDRKQNTIVWQQANTYNLQNNSPQEYQTIKQRRDFYKWYYVEIEKKGHQVVWPKMAYFISNKLRLTKTFPYTIFTKKSIKNYANQGSKTVFNNAFVELKKLFISEKVLKEKEGLSWDETILQKEQQEWIEPIYNSIDSKTLKTIDKMAKGKGFYSFMVAKKIRFQGNINNAETRYDYALYSLRNYCKKRYNKILR